MNAKVRVWTHPLLPLSTPKTHRTKRSRDASSLTGMSRQSSIPAAKSPAYPFPRSPRAELGPTRFFVIPGAKSARQQASARQLERAPRAVRGTKTKKQSATPACSIFHHPLAHGTGVYSARPFCRAPGPRKIDSSEAAAPGKKEGGARLNLI